MPDRDIYRVINELDPATVEALGERLEFRGSDATFNRMRETYFDQLPRSQPRRSSISAAGLALKYAPS